MSKFANFHIYISDNNCIKVYYTIDKFLRIYPAKLEDFIRRNDMKIIIASDYVYNLISDIKDKQILERCICVRTMLLLYMPDLVLKRSTLHLLAQANKQRKFTDIPITAKTQIYIISLLIAQLARYLGFLCGYKKMIHTYINNYMIETDQSALEKVIRIHNRYLSHNSDCTDEELYKKNFIGLKTAFDKIRELKGCRMVNGKYRYHASVSGRYYSNIFHSMPANRSKEPITLSTAELYNYPTRDLSLWVCRGVWKLKGVVYSIDIKNADFESAKIIMGLDENITYSSFLDNKFDEGLSKLIILKTMYRSSLKKAIETTSGFDSTQIEKAYNHSNMRYRPLQDAIDILIHSIIDCLDRRIEETTIEVLHDIKFEINISEIMKCMKITLKRADVVITRVFYTMVVLQDRKIYYGSKGQQGFGINGCGTQLTANKLLAHVNQSRTQGIMEDIAFELHKRGIPNDIISLHDEVIFGTHAKHEDIINVVDLFKDKARFSIKTADKILNL